MTNTFMKKPDTFYWLQGYNCCGYGTKGTKTNSGGNDCIVIPGARKATSASGVIAASQCNHGKGLGTAKDSATKTVCCKSISNLD